jgi:hypothetical protein
MNWNERQQAQKTSGEEYRVDAEIEKERIREELSNLI